MGRTHRRHPEVRASSASLEGWELRSCAAHPSRRAREGAHLRMTGVHAEIRIQISNSERCASAFSRRGAPEFCVDCHPLKKRGRRESRMRAAPAVSCANMHNKNAHEHTGSAEAIRLSLRNGFNGLFRALPGDRAFLPPSPARNFVSRELDASVGASGPHGFAVRDNSVRHLLPSRPPHPTARS
jgi:hypothetical protein